MIQRIFAAQDKYGLDITAEKGFGTLPSGDLIVLVGSIVNILLGLLGIFFTILIIIGGVQWMTAGGSEEKIKKAQGLIKNAVIGLCVVVGAYALAYFILSQIVPKILLTT
jgi:hypothetical protein